MKLIHLSDLHLGKRVNEFSMIEDQAYILTEIINIIDDEAPSAVVIAGDVYDKSVPSTEAVELFDNFLVRLAKRNIQVFIISGNHDSPERLAFAGRLIDISGVHLSPVYNGNITPFALDDEFGRVNIFMLPFIKPVHVRKLFPEEKIDTYTDAVRTAIEKMEINTEERNILVTHQFVTGADRCQSEEISVGGSDNVDADVFEAFDYTALGHIHGPQDIIPDRVRYSGTPLKYSFSEVKHKKSVTVAELKEKGNISIRTIPLTPKHDMAEIRGTYDELTLKSFYENTSYCEDYIHITLTDEEEIPYASGKLRAIYKNLMKLDYDNKRTQHSAEINGTLSAEKRSPFDMFSELYRQQNGTDMSEQQEDFMKKLIEEIWEEGK